MGRGVIEQRIAVSKGLAESADERCRDEDAGLGKHLQPEGALAQTPAAGIFMNFRRSALDERAGATSREGGRRPESATSVHSCSYHAS